MKVEFECDTCRGYHDISQIYYCPKCKNFVCSQSTCVISEVDTWYCPVCLKSMPLSDTLSNHYL